MVTKWGFGKIAHFATISLIRGVAMMELLTHRGYHIKNRKGLKHWEPLLEEWLLCIERYCRVAKGEDAPFVYTERANIGLLAGAAWRCGRVALEEFQYEKGYRNKKKWNGRADLYLASEDTDEMIEGKFAWLSLSSTSSAQKRIKSTLSIAMRDAKKTKGGHEGTTCLGVAFLPTWIPAKNRDKLEDKIHATIALLPTLGCHAVAWCFPKEYRHVENSKRNYTPGVVLAVSNPDY